MDDHGEQVAVGLIAEGAGHAVGHGQRLLEVRAFKIAIGEGATNAINSDGVQSSI